MSSLELSSTPLDKVGDSLTLEKSRRSPAYFLRQACQVYDATQSSWIPFHPWPAQLETLDVLTKKQYVAVLKARQLGFTWLALGYALHLMLYRPGSTVLIFSKRDDEAIELLDVRLKGMYDHLPPGLRTVTATTNGKHQWQLSNGSRAMAFPTTGGRSYTGTLAIIDEADFVPDLQKLLNAVQPTVDAGGQLLLLSTADKDKPLSAFKKIYRAAAQGLNEWTAVFYGWMARPDRTQAWYDAKRKVAEDTQSFDELWQEYPETDVQALAQRELNKRIASRWLEQCYQERRPLVAPKLPETAPAIPGLEVFALPLVGRRYAIGADPAEGNPTSDDSALEVIDLATGEEVACLAGKLQPETLATYADAVGTWYNRADLLFEKNNHGHACLLWLRGNSKLRCLTGHDGKPGWLSNSKGKALLYDRCAEGFRDGEVMLHSSLTAQQIQSIEGSTLRAPEGLQDDRADAWALAVQVYLGGPQPSTPPRAVAPGVTGVTPNRNMGRPPAW